MDNFFYKKYTAEQRKVWAAKFALWYCQHVLQNIEPNIEGFQYPAEYYQELNKTMLQYVNEALAEIEKIEKGGEQ